MTNMDLMKKIQELSFAKVEAELYLDTHPTSRAALDYYEELIGELDEVMTKYQNEVGAIYHMAASKDSWSWVDNDWPWHNKPLSEDK